MSDEQEKGGPEKEDQDLPPEMEMEDAGAPPASDPADNPADDPVEEPIPEEEPVWEQDPVPPEWEDASSDPLVLALQEFGEAIESARGFAGDLTLQVRRESIVEVCAALRGEHGFTVLIDLCGVDHPQREPRFDVVYHLRSSEDDRRIVRLRVAAGEETPVPSVSGVWRAAVWLEREVWDLFGVPFENHPDLTRLLLWEGFEGHPLRKDFPLEGLDTGPAAPAPRPEESLDGRVELCLGPRHPALQGVLRLAVEIEDDEIRSVEPVIGSLHRGLEKLFEIHPFLQAVPLSCRLDETAAATWSLAYVGAVEKLTGLVPPPRARFARTLLAELERLASHLLWLATHASDLGAVAPFPLAVATRDRCVDLLERAGGLCPGGLERDLPAGWADSCRELAGELPPRIDAIEELLTHDRIWKKRTIGVGVLSPDLAIALGVTGPLLRASGLPWDLRRDRPYAAYGGLDFDVPVGANGDTYDRYLVRVAEMRQAVRILIQCLDGIPDGPVLAAAAAGPRALTVAAGAEVYHGIEGPRGEIGFYLAGDGTPNPFRCHARAPSFMNLQALREICRGARLGDLMALVGTADLGLGEVDR